MKGSNRDEYIGLVILCDYRTVKNYYRTVRNYFSHPTMIYYKEAQATISLLGQSTENYSYIRDYIGELLLYIVYTCGTSYISSVGVIMGVSYGPIGQGMPAQDLLVLPNLVLINSCKTVRTYSPENNLQVASTQYYILQ